MTQPNRCVKPLIAMSEPVTKKRPEALAIIDPTWTDADAQAFRDYLQRNGIFLAYIAARAPQIDDSTIERAALTGARHRGFEDLFQVIAGMIVRQPSEDNADFVGNEDDSQLP